MRWKFFQNLKRFRISIFTQKRKRRILLISAHLVIRRFVGDDDVVRMALVQAGGGDFDETRFGF
jgi:hypothetical protein